MQKKTSTTEEPVIAIQESDFMVKGEDPADQVKPAPKIDLAQLLGNALAGGLKKPPLNSSSEERKKKMSQSSELDSSIKSSERRPDEVRPLRAQKTLKQSKGEAAASPAKAPALLSNINSLKRAITKRTFDRNA